MTSYIRDYGPEIAAAYPVCAITPGDKRPIGKDWINRPLSPEVCANFPNENAGVGIICGKGDKPCYAFDADIMGDTKCAEAMRTAIEEALGQSALYRVGSAPKFLVPVRGTEAGWKKAVTPWYEKGGLRSRVEFLGDGQQFVALAIHPTTSQPYQWFGAPLMGQVIDPPELLPEVTAEKVQEILDKACKVFEEFGWVRADGGTEVKGTSEVTAEELTPQYPMGCSIDEARTWLKDFPGADDYETWLKVGMALHFEFAHRENADEALALWDEWSSKSDHYKGFDDLRYRWSTFGAKSGLSVTMRWLQFEYQKRNYDEAGELTESGRAARFATYFRGTLRFAIDTGKWYQWNGLVWRELYPTEILALVHYSLTDLLRADLEEMSRGMDDKGKADLRRFYLSMQQAPRISRVEAIARQKSILWIRGSDFDANPKYFAVRNGVIDLENLAFVPPKPEMMCSRCAGTSYEERAECPTWEKTVLEIFNGDTEMAKYVQRYFGYAMLGTPTEEIMGIFHGNGCNGKSTMVNVLRDLFGEYGHTASADLLTSIGSSRTSAGGARADLVALRGKRFVVVSEIDQRARMQESMMKALVSQDEISARGLYQAGVSTFRPSWVVTMLTNYMPRIDGGDDGVWRRIHAVPFDRDFDKDPTVTKDTRRAEKLRAELPGILNWLLEGVRQYRLQGMTLPTKVEDERREYRGSNDVLGEWLAERCVFDKDSFVPTSEAWASWESFSKANGVDHAINDKGKLSRALKRKGIPSKPKALPEGRITRCYLGIRLGEGSL